MSTHELTVAVFRVERPSGGSSKTGKTGPPYELLGAGKFEMCKIFSQKISTREDKTVNKSRLTPDWTVLQK